MADIGNVIKRLFTTPNHRFLISEADSQAAETAKVIYDDKTGSPAENLSFTIPTGNPPPPPPPECPPGQHRDPTTGECVPDNPPPPPPPEEIVKAKVLTATASKQDSGKEASKVLDGDYETRWSADGVGEWIDFTFDRIYTLKKVKLTGYWYDKSYTFSINAQADFTCPANRQPNTLVEFDISNLNIIGDRVRLIGKGNSATSYNSYREVEFWGIAGDVPPPPPPPPEDCPPGQHKDPVTGQCVPDSPPPPPPPTGTTRLIAFADNDTTNDAEDVLKAIMQVPNVSEYEFVGDGPYSKSGTKWVSMMKKYFSTTDKLRISQGNHDEKESESNQTEKDIEEWIPSLNKSPEGLDWTSSGQVGNVYVISGNTQDMDVEFKRDQYNWLVSELDKAKQLRAAGQIDWIVYLAHKPFFTLKSSHSPYTAVRHLYKDIFKNVVDFVIHGHNHNTQLWKPMIPNASDANGEGQQLFSLMPDGKTYDFTKDHGWLGIVTGHAGHEWNGINDSGSGVQNVMHYRDSGKFGFTQLDFEGKTATVKSIDTNGTVHFEYKVSRGSDSPPPPPPPPGNLNAKFPELIKRAVPGTIVVLDGSQSTGPIISWDIVQTTGNPTVTLQPVATPKYSKQFVMPDTNEPLLFVLQVHDTAGNTDTDTISVIKDLLPPPPTGEVDDFGTRMLYKTTGKKVDMEKGSDHRNGQRYNVNHTYTNYMMIGYFKTGRGQEVLEMKTDGPNHGGCDKLPQCMWYEPHIDVDTGKVSLGGEWPHPDNHNDLKTDFTENLKKPIKETWVGYAVVAYTSPAGNRVIEQWDALDPFGSDGKPTNNWHMNLKVEDTKGKVFPSQYHPRMPPINFDEGLEAEIRMHRGTNHDTEMKFCRVYEIIPPT